MDVAALSMIDLTNPRVQLVVSDAAPVGHLFVVNRLACRSCHGRDVVHVHAVGIHRTAVTWTVCGRWGIRTMIVRTLEMLKHLLEIKNWCSSYKTPRTEYWASAIFKWLKPKDTIWSCYSHPIPKLNKKLVFRWFWNILVKTI